MLQCYKDDLNLKRLKIWKLREENFKECISKVSKTIEGIGTAITQSTQFFQNSELVKMRQNLAPHQFPQEIFQNVNPYITNQNGLASPPSNYASYAAGSNLSLESFLKSLHGGCFSNFSTPRKDQ